MSDVESPPYLKNDCYSRLCADLMFELQMSVLQNANEVASEEIDVTQMVKNVEKVDQSYFELLKVLGQGSFGKVGRVIFCCYDSMLM